MVTSGYSATPFPKKLGIEGRAPGHGTVAGTPQKRAPRSAWSHTIRGMRTWLTARSISSVLRPSVKIKRRCTHSKNRVSTSRPESSRSVVD